MTETRTERQPFLRPFVGGAAAFADGTRTPRAYLEECIEALDAWEPSIEAFVNVDLDAARRAADASTARWHAGAPLSAIDGMPIGVKDIIETANMPTEMGSPLFAGYRSERDAASVVALRDAGAVIVGKTVTTEFAATFPGKTRNPWDTTRTPGGSSSGSAAAVGAGILPAALGTQVIGSILRPSSYCGCVGFKPTVGSINRGGSFDYLSQSAQGVLAATLADAWSVAWTVSSLAGGDPGRPGLRGPAAVPAASAPRSIAFLETSGWARAADEARDQLAALLTEVRERGVLVRNRHDDPLIEEVEQGIAAAMPLSLKINTWEGRWPLNTLARDRDRNGLSPASQERLAEAERMTIEEYRSAIAERDRIRASYARLRGTYDVVISLSAPGPAPVGLQSTGDPTFVVPGSLLGVPAISLPLLRCAGLPLGVQLLGFAEEDATLFGLAAWFDR